MKPQIIKSLKNRIDEEITNREQIRYLKEFPIETYYDTLISIIYLYTRPKKGQTKPAIYFTEIISAIGHTVRTKLKQKRDSGRAAKTGAFLLYTFEELGLIQVMLGASVKGHGQYVVQVLNDDAICKLWTAIETSKIEKLPSETPYAPWATSKHACGAQMVKTGNREVLDSLTPETHPMVFDCVNKAQEVGWNINKSVYDIYTWALRNRTDAFSEIWELASVEAKTTKIREAFAIGEIAKRFIGKTFYHLYYYDFRGRKYPTTAYLHEQGSDLARGLLLRSDKKTIGKEGFFWLLVSIASNWAGDAGRPDKAKTDKIPLQARYEWALDNEEIFLSYASNPKVNQGWMKADKPWQFLAACNELMNLRIWQMERDDLHDFSYSSHLECYIDGSNNGSQHLAALTRDEITAPHVNLVPLEYPGDLYKYVGDHVWEHLKEVVDSIPKEELADINRYIDTVIEFKKQIALAEPRSEHRVEIINKAKAYKADNEYLAGRSSPVFWMRIHDAKQRRKVVKRNVMTLPYGGTSYGLGEQQINDAKKHGIDLLYHMEHKWGAYMGREVYDDCRISLERPMQLLEVFEAAGRKAEAEGRFLSWTVPVTNFPVVQNYTEGVTKKIWVQYGPKQGEVLNTGYYANTLQLAICFIEETVPSKGKQAQGASPNAIHSLDAAHLTLTVHRADFPITTIHDSFGCLLADMPKLFKLIRQTFVELYEADPLSSLMTDIEGDIRNVQIGTLDISLVLDSEYCFA
jgi:DNA-directed RNA polymerase